MIIVYQFSTISFVFEILVSIIFLFQTMYKTESLIYLINSEDTIAAYEKKGKEKSSKVMENAANHISQMNHVQQVELMRGKAKSF